MTQRSYMNFPRSLDPKAMAIEGLPSASKGKSVTPASEYTVVLTFALDNFNIFTMFDSDLLFPFKFCFSGSIVPEAEFPVL